MPTTYKLTIRLSGLCLLAHDTKEKKVHAIMPATGGHMGGNHVHQHTAEWLLDIGYFTGGPLRNDFVRVAFDNQVADLSALQTTYPLDTQSLQYVPSITEILGYKLKRSVMNGALSNDQVARLTFKHGKAGNPGCGANYEFAGKPIVMPPAIDWTIDSITAWPPTGSDFPSFFQYVQPINNEIQLFLFNAPPEEMPTKPTDKPKPGHKPNKPPHYASFYKLFTGAESETRLPEYVSDNSCMQMAARGSGDVSILGINPYTCMLGGGDG